MRNGMKAIQRWHRLNGRAVDEDVEQVRVRIHSGVVGTCPHISEAIVLGYL